MDQKEKLVEILTGSIQKMLQRLQQISLHPEKHFIEIEFLMMDKVKILADDDFCKALKKNLSKRHECVVVVEKTDSKNIVKILLIGNNILTTFAEILDVIIKSTPSRKEICEKIKSKIRPLIDKSLGKKCEIKCSYRKTKGIYMLSIIDRDTCISFSFWEKNPGKLPTLIEKSLDDISIIAENMRTKKNSRKK